MRSAFELLKEGGEWLGAARNWIKWHCINGSHVTWGSREELLPHLTVADVEEIASEVAASALADLAKERERAEATITALRDELAECRAELASACDERDTADAELSECRAELENAVKCYRSFCAKFNAADGARQAAEARAEFGARVVEAARARLECWTRETYDVLVGALRMYDAALAEIAQKTSEAGTREGPTSEKQTATQTTRAREEVATPSRPAEAPKSPGSPSGDEPPKEQNYEGLGAFWKACDEYRKKQTPLVNAARGRDPSGVNEDENIPAQASEDDADHEENCACVLDGDEACDCKPAQASGDDAERAARDWWFGAFGKDVNKPAIAGLRNMIRARDAQAREAGRVEERNAIVRYLSVWSDSVRDNEAIDGRLQALVTDTHKSNIAKGEHITRPDRAKEKP